MRVIEIDVGVTAPIVSGIAGSDPLGWWLDYPWVQRCGEFVQWGDLRNLGEAALSAVITFATISAIGGLVLGFYCVAVAPHCDPEPNHCDCFSDNVTAPKS